MTVTADRLVERIFPLVPVRQWVLSFPRQVRFHLARNSGLRRKVLAIFIDEIFRDTRRRAGVTSGECGAVTVEQRFGSGLNLNQHLHSIVLDGVFTSWKNFRQARPPTNDEMHALAKRMRDRIVACLKRAGVPIGPGAESSEDASVYDAVQSASIQGLIALAEDPRRVRKVGAEPGLFENQAPKEFCADVEGFSLHAAVRIAANDREGLRRLCRYILRPPFSGERLSLAEDGSVIYRLRREWYDGTTHIVLKPLEFLEKLSALVPLPRAHQIHYSGILARHHAWREQILPRPPAQEASRPTSEDWATLLKKTFGVDPLACPRCGGSMKIISTITQARVIRKILSAMGHATEAPLISPARSPPGELDWSEGSGADAA